MYYILEGSGKDTPGWFILKRVTENGDGSLLLLEDNAEKRMDEYEVPEIEFSKIQTLRGGLKQEECLSW
jgi:hypothetical protein